MTRPTPPTEYRPANPALARQRWVRLAQLFARTEARINNKGEGNRK